MRGTYVDNISNHNLPIDFKLRIKENKLKYRELNLIKIISEELKELIFNLNKFISLSDTWYTFLYHVNRISSIIIGSDYNIRNIISGKEKRVFSILTIIFIIIVIIFQF